MQDYRSQRNSQFRQIECFLFNEMEVNSSMKCNERTNSTDWSSPRTLRHTNRRRGKHEIKFSATDDNECMQGVNCACGGGYYDEGAIEGEGDRDDDGGGGQDDVSNGLARKKHLILYNHSSMEGSHHEIIACPHPL